MNPETKKRIEGPFNKALELKRQGCYIEAVAILTKLSAEYPRHPAVFGVLGSIYKKMGDLQNACKCFRRTVELSPNSELASLNLFHILFRMGCKSEAFAEMERFLSLSDSEEYRRLLVDINGSLADDPGRYTELVDDALPH